MRPPQCRARNLVIYHHGASALDYGCGDHFTAPAEVADQIPWLIAL
jgi:hypothetical protein